MGIGTNNMYKVRLISYEYDEVVTEIEVDSFAKAEKVEDGININLNHDRFYTDIVED